MTLAPYALFGEMTLRSNDPSEQWRVPTYLPITDGLFPQSVYEVPMSERITTDPLWSKYFNVDVIVSLDVSIERRIGKSLHQIWWKKVNRCFRPIFHHGYTGGSNHK